MRLLNLILTFLFLSQLHAQHSSYQVSGTILDESGKGLPGVQVLLKDSQGLLLKNDLTTDLGRFSIGGLVPGAYQLEWRFLGYASQLENIQITNQDIQLSPIALQPEPRTLGEVLVKEKKPIGAVLSDTLQFQASSFKVAENASADELIEKMPSVVKENGAVKSQGEEVRQVLVDGKPFFGDDPNLSLKNLPAELIDKVQIFDQLSEQSQFTGINDGNTVKTINIVTKSGYNSGQFGKVYGGYGYEDKYQTGGNFNYFDGSRRVSLIGMSNNINIQNFSVDDILGALNANNNQRNRGGGQRGPGGSRGGPTGGPSGGGVGDFLVPLTGGISTTHAAGINFSDQLGKKVELNASYFVNYSSNRIENELVRTYYQTGPESQVYEETASGKPKFGNHRFQAKLEYKIDSFHSITFRPRLTYQGSIGSSFIHSRSFNDSVLAANTFNGIESDGKGWNSSNNLLYRFKFKKPGRTFSVDLNGNLAPKSETGNQNSVSILTDSIGTSTDTLNQKEFRESDSWGFNSNIEYTEPLNIKNSISINYRAAYQEDQSDWQTYDILSETGQDQLNAELSNRFITDQNSHQIGIGYRYNLEQKVNISLRSAWQVARLNNEELFPMAGTTRKAFHNILPSMYLRYNVKKSINMGLHYRTSAQLPGVNQLQAVLDDKNPLLLSIGNPDLKQSLNHRIHARLSINQTNGNMWYLSLGATVIEDYITNHLFIGSRNHPIFQTISIPAGSQLSLPENTGNYSQFRSFVSFTIPLPIIKCNLSLDGSYFKTYIPGLLDAIRYTAKQDNIAMGLSLTSNISKKLDFNLQFRPSYYFYTSPSSKDEYYVLDGKFRLSWEFYQGFIFRTDVNSLINQNLNDQFNQNIWLVNLAIGKKIFKNQRGELALGINDLFKQNESITRTVTEYAVEDLRTNNLQRFLMLSFTYQIRNYNSGKKTQKPHSEQERMRMW
ncbi:MAG TPA: TonB-dependent receptor [Saprospiraceae bacterium]|nr:TonB-dependent receptor [Saprospiraceae bacterium]